MTVHIKQNPRVNHVGNGVHLIDAQFRDRSFWPDSDNKLSISFESDDPRLSLPWEQAQLVAYRLIAQELKRRGFS